MKKINIKEIIQGLNIEDAFAEVFAKKLNKSKEEIKIHFNEIVDKEINNIGKAMQEAISKPQDNSKLRDLSVDEFLEKNDKIIKDK